MGKYLVVDSEGNCDLYDEILPLVDMAKEIGTYDNFVKALKDETAIFAVVNGEISKITVEEFINDKLSIV